MRPSVGVVGSVEIGEAASTPTGSAAPEPWGSRREPWAVPPAVMRARNTYVDGSLSSGMERSGRFRVYRTVESVPHINVQGTDSPTLYSVYRSGYGDLQPTVDALETGDLIEATLAGDPDDADPWRLTAVDRVDRVRTAFAVDVDPPEAVREGWTPDRTEPAYTRLTPDGEPIGVRGVQPRDPLPGGAFVPSVVTGLLPLESVFEAVPTVGDPAVEAIFLDFDDPGASSYAWPYGVVYLFTRRSTAFAERLVERYDCPFDADTRPAFDPYALRR